MDFRLQTILEKIERLREIMYSMLSGSKQLTDKPLINCSQQLDKLLNEYEIYKNNINSDDAA